MHYRTAMSIPHFKKIVLSISLPQSDTPSLKSLRHEAEQLFYKTPWPYDYDLGDGPPWHEWENEYKHVYYMMMRIGMPVVIYFGSKKQARDQAQRIRISIPDLDGNGTYAEGELIYDLFKWINGKKKMGAQSTKN